MRFWLMGGFIVAFPFTLLLLFLLFLEGGSAPKPPRMPAQNGYDDLLDAGKKVQWNDYTELDQKGLQGFVEANANALQLARDGFQKESRVPVQYSQNYLTNHIEDFTFTKRLAHAFAAEGRLAEMEGRTNDAANAYLDIVRLGNDSVRGGMLIDELVGIAIESMGVARLEKLVPSLDRHVSEGAASTLEAIDLQAQTIDDVMKQENVFFHAIYQGWRYDLLRRQSRKSIEPAIQKAKEKANAETKKRRQLTLDLAVHAYEVDKGRLPASAVDLVPDYLKAVPKDPATDAEMEMVEPRNAPRK
ncbi:MAG TPA: hypothetical protein VN625_08940 [Desulfuromonadaceae bacterium]|nr:hypothetical protein [Desulfuromonadaceae bacterium]